MNARVSSEHCGDRDGMVIIIDIMLPCGAYIEPERALSVPGKDYPIVTARTRDCYNYY